MIMYWRVAGSEFHNGTLISDEVKLFPILTISLCREEVK